jgi:hypothetical protein
MEPSSVKLTSSGREMLFSSNASRIVLIFSILNGLLLKPGLFLIKKTLPLLARNNRIAVSSIIGERIIKRNSTIKKSHKGLIKYLYIN